MKKKVHIIVQHGLVQAVYADNGLDVDVEILDMDTEDEVENNEVCAAIAKLSEFATMIY